MTEQFRSRTPSPDQSVDYAGVEHRGMIEILGCNQLRRKMLFDRIATYRGQLRAVRGKSVAPAVSAQRVKRPLHVGIEPRQRQAVGIAQPDAPEIFDGDITGGDAGVGSPSAPGEFSSTRVRRIESKCMIGKRRRSSRTSQSRPVDRMPGADRFLAPSPSRYFGSVSSQATQGGGHDEG